MKKLRQQKEENRRFETDGARASLGYSGAEGAHHNKLVSPRRKDRRHIEVVERGIDLRRDGCKRRHGLNIDLNPRASARILTSDRQNLLQRHKCSEICTALPRRLYSADQA